MQKRSGMRSALLQCKELLIQHAHWPADAYPYTFRSNSFQLISDISFLQRKEIGGLGGSSQGWRGAKQEAGHNKWTSGGASALQERVCLCNGDGELLDLQDAAGWYVHLHKCTHLCMPGVNANDMILDTLVGVCAKTAAT